MTSRLLIVVLLAASAGPALAQPSRDELRERHGLLLERNMFLKDRRPAAPPRERETGETVPPPIESLYVVIGLVEEGDRFRAHVEDRRTGELLRLQPGDEVAQGRVESVDLDAIVYVSGDTRTRIAIGQDLRGEAATAAPTPRGSPEPATAGADGTSAPDPASLSIEERMRLRRLQGGSQ